MKHVNKVLPALIVFLAAALPLAAFTLIESVPMQQRIRVNQGAAFRSQVQLSQVALCDGSVRLQPGTYSVEFVSMADGSVRTSFFDRSGQKLGEAHGIIIVNSKPAAHSTVNAAAAGGGGGAGKSGFTGPITFASLKFTTTAKSSFSQMGNKLNLEVSSTDGGHSILIGLLLPAVQKQMPAGQQTAH